MEPETIIMIVIGVVVLLALGLGAGWFLGNRRRSAELRERFGPEYDHTVQTIGDKRKAEEELETRRKRVESLNIRQLSSSEREHYLREWRAIQADFVDRPRHAIREADRLIQDVMQDRGYPVSDFEQRAADISVHYPEVVRNYRAAREIAARNERQEADTEELRQAMVHYRSLFEELLETDEVESQERTR